ncbi:unnamed protein product [Danaus chrysippus]|uniref:(African queen) hypothetical protein n=1 Tax=Danaus chrysippus TaxID=151541 RepID=A0A8J2QJQ4_9NEOP|nr:unnamed protein product [Danaus chrysippus]
MPIAMTKEEWSRIKRWTDLGREDPDTVRRREYLKYQNDTSREMTKQWPNSLENVNKRNEELRRARVEAAEKTNTRFYQRYVKRKKEEQQRLMYSARDTVFKNKDAPKLLLSAVIETAIQKEREEQLKFKQKLKEEADERKRQDDDDIIRKAKEWNELVETKKKRRFDANKRHQKDILEQAHEVAERNRREYETELNLQKIDNIKAREQMEAIKKFEEEFSAAEKCRILNDLEQARSEAATRREEVRARDQLDDRLIQLLQKTQARVEQRRRNTEKQIQAEKLQVLEKISQKLESGDAAREEKEQRILDKAIKEKEEVAEARRQADARKREQFRAQRMAAREQFLKQQQQTLHEFNTMRQWEVMNRFKNAEIYEDFQARLRHEKETKIKQYREDIIKQWHERAEREARELAETRYFYGELAESKLRDADNKLLTHGHALLQEARDHQRPTYALTQAIRRYCKLYRLYPMPELPSSQQEHFPRYGPKDMSLPDPHYRYPEPPVFDDDKRDGLNDPQKAGPSAASEQPAEEQDYKRAAPANGLQRKPSKSDLKLPSVE